MRLSDSHVAPSLLTTISLMALLLISSCGGSQDASQPSADTGDPTDVIQVAAAASDEQDQESLPASGEILPGALEQVGDSLFLKFQVLEDTTLAGFFHIPDTERERSVQIGNLPANGELTLIADSNAFKYVPEPDFWGTDTFSYSTASSRQVVVDLDIRAVNDAPFFTVNVVPETIQQGLLFTYGLSATDPDDDTLHYSASGKPDWLTLDTATGHLSGIPDQSDVGRITDVAFRVSDESGLFDELVGITLNVVDINDAPSVSLSQAPSEIYARKSVSFDSFPVDDDNDPVTVRVLDSEGFTASVSNEGEITLVAKDVKSVTRETVSVVAEDNRGGFSEETFELTILPRTSSGRGITLHGSESGPGVHVIFMGDGYTAGEMRDFRQHIHDAIANIESDEGIGMHLGAFNFHLIETISEDSGVDDSDTADLKDTFFDATYGCRSIQRLICADTTKLYQTALDDFDSIDQLILLVNDARYGGSGNSGGRIAITSAFWTEIALHEMGHSLADLADEYVDSSIVGSPDAPPFLEGRYANVSLHSDPARVPWKHWLDASRPIPQSDGEAGIGIFQGGFYRPQGVWRSAFDTRMRNYSSGFGPVNSEQWILRLYALTDGVRDLSPMSEQLDVTLGNPQTFSVDPIFGTSVQTVSWILNGEILEPVGDSTTITLELPFGDHSVELIVRDTSGTIRIAPPHAGIFERNWTVRVR